MARPIGKGTISFGLLNVAVPLLSGERTRQYLAAPMAPDSALRLDLIRFPLELLPSEEFEPPTGALAAYHINERELDMAAQLLQAMITKWRPADDRDDFRNKWRSFIEQRIAAKRGGKVPETAPQPAPRATSNVVDFMGLLKNSPEPEGQRGPRNQRSRPAAARTSSSHGHRAH